MPLYPFRTDLAGTQNAYNTFTLRLRDGRGGPFVDLSTYIGASFKVRKSPKGEVIFERTLGNGVVFTVPAQGTLTITVVPGDTADVYLSEYADFRELFYDLELTQASGAYLVACRGRLLLHANF